MLTTQTLATPVGPMQAVFSPQGLCMLEFAHSKLCAPQLAAVLRAKGTSELLEQESAASRALTLELAQYFAGERQAFTQPLDIIGSDFQRSVWQSLLQIPYGATWSYAEQARHMGRESAVRAVANANGQNKIAIVIPCHRVIGSNGTLTGFGGGLDAKRLLLNLERQTMGEQPLFS